jgi:hypothetical protein
VGELADRGEEGIGAVLVDQVDQGHQVVTSGVVFGVLAQLAPGGEEEEFGVPGAASFSQVAGGGGQSAQGLSSPGQGHAVAGSEMFHDFGDGADIGEAQDRVGVVEGAEFGGDGLGAVQADGGACDGEPAIGFGGEVGAEAEGLRQAQGGAVETGHDVAGAAPAVDGLGGVADHDQLGVVALGGEDLFDHGVGVLGFVQQQVVGGDFRFGQDPGG